MRVVRFAAIEFCLSIAILGTMASAPAKARFIGETVSVDYHWPTLGSVYLSSGNAVVGVGVEFSSIGNFSPAADIADESFTITYSNTWHLSGGATFDGLVLTAMTADIIGVSIDSNTFGFVPTLTFDGQHVYVNQAGAAFLPAGASLTVNVKFAAAEIPEPAALTIIGLGITGLAIARRRRSI